MATTTSTPGTVTLHHGTGIARTYIVIGSTGSAYETTESTCTCMAGRSGRDCKHCKRIREIHATESQALAEPAADPFASLDSFGANTDAMMIVYTALTDHAVTVATAAELLGGQKPLKVATVRRYLAAGKLTALDGGISAASITTYAAARTVNVTRTRFRPTGRRTGRPTRVSPATVTTVPAAHAALTEARKLEAIVKELRAAAKTTLEAAGAGTVVDGVVVVLKPGRQIQDNKKIKADYQARGQALPMTTSAPSWDAIPVR